MAVRNDADIQASFVGQGLESNANRADLVVGRRLNFVSGQVPNGKIWVGTSPTIGVDTKILGGVEILNETPWSQNEKVLNGLSQSLMTFRSNSKVDFVCQSHDDSEVCQLHLNGTHELLNLFELEGSELSRASVLNLSLPAGATAVINVIGSPSIRMRDIVFNFSSSVDSKKVLFNFAQTNSVSIIQSAVNGTFLAPLANLKVMSSEFEGQLISQGFESNCSKKDACVVMIGQKFEGCLPQW
jgi:choice-of-anchor A domain-containing protein